LLNDLVLNFVFIEKISLGSHLLELGKDLGIEGHVFLGQ
jgi:hypothetical protein